MTPRTFDPPPGWSPDGHRVKAPLTYSRGPDKTWIYGGLRIGDGQAVTMCAPSRNSAHWQAFLARLEQADPTGPIAVITDNLSSHSSVATRAWLAGHPRIEQVFIPKGACWLNLQEAWWRIFRRHALAGQTFADPAEITQATELATAQLNTTPDHGSGDDPRHRRDPDDGALPTCFEERSTRSPRVGAATGPSSGQGCAGRA